MFQRSPKINKQLHVGETWRIITSEIPIHTVPEIYFIEQKYDEGRPCFFTYIGSQGVHGYVFKIHDVWTFLSKDSRSRGVMHTLCYIETPINLTFFLPITDFDHSICAEHPAEHV